VLLVIVVMHVVCVRCMIVTTRTFLLILILPGRDRLSIVIRSGLLELSSIDLVVGSSDSVVLIM